MNVLNVFETLDSVHTNTAHARPAEATAAVRLANMMVGLVCLLQREREREGCNDDDIYDPCARGRACVVLCCGLAYVE